MPACDLYLDLLAKCVTGTLHATEPDHDNADPGRFVVQFTLHYMRGTAITMLPRVRLDNLRGCIETILRDGVPGDLIETGVWRGGGCVFMRGCLDVLGGADRTTWVADSFEGLPEPDPANVKEFEFFHSASMQKHYARMAATLAEVEANFAAYSLLSERVRFLKGWFKDTLPTAPIERLSLMRLDGDYYQSTMDGLQALYPKLAVGGFVIIDDYGEDLWTNCREAVNDYRHANRIDDPIIRVDSKCAFWRRSK